MRRTGMLLFCVGFMFVGAVTANALTFSDTEEFSGTVKEGRDAMELGNNSSLFEFPFTHNVLFVPEAASITSAQITISHYANSGPSTGELWFLYGGTSTPIGNLEDSQADWNDQVFTLPSDLYSPISGGTWSLALILRESTSGTDRLWIDKSVLSGEYNPVAPDTPFVPPPTDNTSAVPEPSTFFLLGTGLLAITGVRLRKKEQS